MNWQGRFAGIWIFRSGSERWGAVQYRAVVKKSGNWWIGWLVDIPGVNAQEKTKEKLIESLKICAQDMLNTPFEPKDEEELVKIEFST